MIHALKIRTLAARTLTAQVLRTAAAAACMIAGAALAQGYPNRPITFIYPFTPGTPVGESYRSMAVEAGRILGQPMVVENRGGAGGRLGIMAVSKAPPEGYLLSTVLDSTMAVVPLVSESFKLQPIKDYVPITIASEGYNVLSAHVGLPFRDLKGLVAYAKANPGKLNYGTNGIGSSIHLYMELLMAATGTEMTHIPYKGQTESIPDRLSGTTHFWFGAAEAKPFIEKGQLVAIVTSGPQRMKEFPDTPTLIESGVNLTLKAWLGVVAPPGTPPDVITKLNAAFAAALNSAEVRKRFEFAGHVGVGTGPDEMLKRIRADAEAYAPIVRRINLKLD